MKSLWMLEKIVSCWFVVFYFILVEELKQGAKRRKGRGFNDKEQGSGGQGSYDTLKGDGAGPQRSIDVCFMNILICFLDENIYFFSNNCFSGLDCFHHWNQ